MYFFTFSKCPQCELPQDFFFYLISTRLGPPTVICSRCETLIATNRKEWPFVGFAENLRFLIACLVILALGATIAGNLFYAAWELSHGNANPANLPTHDPLFQRFWGIGAGLCLAILLKKVLASRSRVLRAAEPMRSSLARHPFTFGTQLYFLIFCVLIYEAGKYLPAIFSAN